jgi:uncharacterized protein (DUF433 family)
MSTISYPHLTLHEDGSLHIGQSRYKVKHLAAEHYAYGWSAEELLRQHPDLRPEEVYACLTYFYDHFDQMVEEIKSGDQIAEQHRSRQKLSREELLKRKA